MISDLASDKWETPDDLFQGLDARYHFYLDAAADETNHKCPRWLGPGGLETDALICSWEPWLREGNIWCNPPYSRGFQRVFVEQALKQRHRTGENLIVMLLPADTSTKLYHEVVKNLPHTFIQGRLKFKGAPGPAKFGSMLVYI